MLKRFNGHEEIALSGAYALMGLSKVIGSTGVAAQYNSENTVSNTGSELYSDVTRASNATSCIRDVEDDDEFLAALRTSQNSGNFANKHAANSYFGEHWNSDFDSDFETTSNQQQKTRSVLTHQSVEHFDMQEQQHEVPTQTSTWVSEIPNLEDLVKDRIFFVNSAEELLAIVKEQAATRKFKASIGLGTKMGMNVKNPVIHVICSRSGFSAKNEQMLKGKAAKTSPASKENPGTKTSDLSKLVKPKQTRKSSSLKCGCQ